MAPTRPPSLSLSTPVLGCVSGAGAENAGRRDVQTGEVPAESAALSVPEQGHERHQPAAPGPARIPVFFTAWLPALPLNFRDTLCCGIRLSWSRFPPTENKRLNQSSTWERAGGLHTRWQGLRPVVHAWLINSARTDCIAPRTLELAGTVLDRCTVISSTNHSNTV